jgi:hypothetical protein
MIGKLSSSIKSRQHPEENLLNRYLRSVATRGVGFTAAEAELEDDAIAPADVHPLIHNDARNSMVDSQTIVWPAVLTRSNSLPSDIPRVAMEHIRGRIIFPMLGQEECDEHLLKSCAFTFSYIMVKVRVGNWRYSFFECEEVIYNAEDEDPRLNRSMGKTRASWFTVHSRDVPHYQRTSPDDANEYVYGRIIRFAQLTIPAWRAEPFLLAKVYIYDNQGVEPVTGFNIINTIRPCKYTDKDGRSRFIEYIQVKHLRGCIAVAPVNTPHRADIISPVLYVLPIEV